jgi:hypothetical protein
MISQFNREELQMRKPLARLFVLLTLLLAVCSVLVATTASKALEPARLALLIGKPNYAAKVGPLTNPHNDVALLEASLKRLRFTVTALKDATYRDMDTTIKRHVADVPLSWVKVDRKEFEKIPEKLRTEGLHALTIAAEGRESR